MRADYDKKANIVESGLSASSSEAIHSGLFRHGYWLIRQLVTSKMGKKNPKYMQGKKDQQSIRIVKTKTGHSVSLFSSGTLLAKSDLTVTALPLNGSVWYDNDSYIPKLFSEVFSQHCSLSCLHFHFESIILSFSNDQCQKMD